MPFLQLSFSTHESAIQFQQSVNQSLRRLYLPIRPLNVLLDLSIRDWSSQKPCRKVLYTLHLVLILLLLFSLLVCLLFEPYAIFGMDSTQSFVWIVYAAYFLKIQGFISILFVLIWNIKQKRQNFQSILIESSSGAGCLRKAKRLRAINYAFLLYNLVRLLFTVGIAFMRRFHRSSLFSDEIEAETNWSFFVTNVFTCVVCGIGQIVAFSMISSFACIMSSEFRALADDFRADSNTYQMAVIAHYAFAYKNLLRLHSCVRGFLGFWVNTQLVLAYFQIFYILSTVYPFGNSFETALNLVLFVDAVITIGANGFLVVHVDRALNGLCSSMLTLSISKVLNEGTYSQINTFTEYMRFKRRKTPFFFGLFTINAETVARFTLFIIFFAIWNGFNFTNSS